MHIFYCIFGILLNCVYMNMNTYFAYFSFAYFRNFAYFTVIFTYILIQVRFLDPFSTPALCREEFVKASSHNSK